MLRIVYQMFGKRLPDTEVSALRDLGFVHMTGLPVYSRGGMDYSESLQYIIGAKIKEDELGTWGEKESYVCFVSNSGEVWVAHTCERGQRRIEMMEYLRRLTGGKKGAFVPANTGGCHLHQEDIMRRVAYPYDGLEWVTDTSADRHTETGPLGRDPGTPIPLIK